MGHPAGARFYNTAAGKQAVMDKTAEMEAWVAAQSSGDYFPQAFVSFPTVFRRYVSLAHMRCPLHQGPFILTTPTLCHIPQA